MTYPPQPPHGEWSGRQPPYGEPQRDPYGEPQRDPYGEPQRDPYGQPQRSYGPPAPTDPYATTPPQPPYGPPGQQPPPGPFWGPPQPGQQPPPGMYGPPIPPVRTRRSRKPWLISGLVLLVLCCGGAIVGAVNSLGDKAPAAVSTAGLFATTPAGTPGTSAAKAAAPPATTKAAPRKLMSQSGNGIRNTAKFTTGKDWTLSYTFDCSAFGFKGNFIVTQYDGSTIGGIPVNVLNDKGSDSVPVYDSPGEHYLAVNSECTWTVSVTG